jgi:hypothetical protein
MSGSVSGFSGVGAQGHSAKSGRHTQEAGELLSEERHGGRLCEEVDSVFAGVVMQERERRSEVGVCPVRDALPLSGAVAALPIRSDVLPM